ncbi:MBL fold metallo-hydrolase [Cognatishimia sp. 1_MG-2023]|uniref:MBL fold metallo-hydrolase n=1 Tax=Cognatishimia sp. 1_MG-2023 TaxID=3062642 RepID=UPI0026E1DC81|nr:MBL fold metallo-hydrolase [Cognatishimia sp. 1_MG-2023]MDO6725847.1 MBL fold metallo-hydrolase [Cognatishimia sp. 1_MG-2023]
MSDLLTFTILGCGSSGGVPRLGGHWGECDPNNPKNARTRCSILVERTGPGGTTTVLVDTSPDMRQQLLRENVGRLDGVIYTHAHADHVHGIDDLRMVVFNMRERVPVWADGPTQDALLSRFGYAFVQPDGSPYPAILDLNAIRGDVTVSGPGGDITLKPIEVSHGSIDALAFRVNDVLYMPDVSDIPEAAWDQLQGLECWILDALRRTPHPTHVHLDKALDWIERVAPKQAVLTNMHIDLDYQVIADETANHIQPAYDGLKLTFEI